MESMSKSENIALDIAGTAALLRVLTPSNRSPQGRFVKGIDDPKSIPARVLHQLEHRPGIHLWDELTDQIWGHCADGGPFNTRKILHDALMKLRRTGRWTFKTHYGLGVELLPKAEFPAIVYPECAPMPFRQNAGSWRFVR
jgi:hypothetical protein